jgi:hypothetical protein
VGIKNGVLIATILTASVSAGCAFSTVATSDKCPPVGTIVPFSKVMASQFSRDYVGCNINSTAQFVATGAGIVAVSAPTEGKTVFRVLPPGEKGEKNPLSGEISANLVTLPKEASEILFSLKPGELVQLTGGTHVTANSAVTKLITGGMEHEVPVFVATSAKRVANEPPLGKNTDSVAEPPASKSQSRKKKPM